LSPPVVRTIASIPPTSEPRQTLGYLDPAICDLRKCLSKPPNLNFEDDYLPDCATAQGSALEYFREMDQDSLNLLGVKVIEGEHPGSTYYAAELHRTINEANLAAESAGLPVRYVTKKG
jgi:hypothetical protein